MASLWQVLQILSLEIEYACFTQNSDDNHHTDKEEYNIIIKSIFLFIKGLTLCNYSERHHQTRAN